MAGILIERGGYLREILRLLGASAWDCQWLITGLECYQASGWPGCEKWQQETALIPNEDLLRDIEARDMQFVWGIFSAIPVRYPREEILRSLYGLDCWTEDAEEQNRRFLALEAVTERLVRERGYGAMDAYARRNLNWLLWRGLYHHRPERPVCEEEIETAYLRLWKGER